MELFDVKLTAGIESQVSIVGSFFRVLSGEGRLKLQASNGINGAVIAGIGLDLRVDGGGFDWLRLTSPIDQTVTVLVTDLPTTDSRTLGDFDVSGLVSIVNNGGQSWRDSDVTLNPATPGQELLPAEPDRLVASFQPDTTVYIGGSPSVTVGGGIRVEAGQVVNIENTAALYVASALAGTVRTMESMK